MSPRRSASRAKKSDWCRHTSAAASARNCFLRTDALLAALGARAAKRPVKVALPRAMVPNNTTHRSATIQRVRIGASRDGAITAIAHESWSGNLPNGRTRGRGDPDAFALRRAEPDDVEPELGARPAGSQCDARAERGARACGTRGRDGRGRGKAGDGPGRVPHQERHAGRAGRAGEARVDRPAIQSTTASNQSASAVLTASTCTMPAHWARRSSVGTSGR